MAETEVTAASAANLAAAHGLRYQLSGDANHAQRAWELLEPLIEGRLQVAGSGGNLWTSNSKRIYRSEPVVGAALAYDWCYEAWSPEIRAGCVENWHKKPINDRRSSPP